MAKTLEDLREHLFATLAALRDNTKPMEIERAKAIGDVAKQVIESAKAEVAYVKAIGGDGLRLPVFAALPEKEKTGNGVTTHRLK